eukprot:scaffold146748_cov32-Tisochrysis_lutea.AAC.10
MERKPSPRASPAPPPPREGAKTDLLYSRAVYPQLFCRMEFSSPRGDVIGSEPTSLACRASLALNGELYNYIRVTRAPALLSRVKGGKGRWSDGLVARLGGSAVLMRGGLGASGLGAGRGIASGVVEHWAPWARQDMLPRSR